MIVWQFERSLFGREGGGGSGRANDIIRRRYYFIVNNVNIFVGFIVVLVWVAVKNSTLLYCRRRKPKKL